VTDAIIIPTTDNTRKLITCDCGELVSISLSREAQACPHCKRELAAHDMQFQRGVPC